MKYNSDIRHRKSIRLKGYDYSQPGAYFVTVCTNSKENIFGQIDNGAMILNVAGNIARQFWMDIPNHFPHAGSDEFVVMPNHIHGIIMIAGTNVGANNHLPEYFPSRQYFPIRQKPGTSKTIGSIVRGFKIGITKWFRENTDIHTPWQRNYYEHIIRDENELNRIREYIIDNPLKWELDEENPDRNI